MALYNFALAGFLVRGRPLRALILAIGKLPRHELELLVKSMLLLLRCLLHNTPSPTYCFRVGVVGRGFGERFSRLAMLGSLGHTRRKLTKTSSDFHKFSSPGGTIRDGRLSHFGKPVGVCA